MFHRLKGRLLAGIAATSLLTGCVSTSEVLEVGRDTYSVTSTSDGFRSAAAARESAFQLGAKKCNSLGKHFALVNENSERTRMNIDTTSTVTFRCLADNDPEYQRPDVRKDPNVVIEDQRKH